MDCEHAISLISADMDGEVPADERPGLEAHMATCASCAATAQALRLQDASLRQAFASRREAASAVADRVIAQLRPTAAGATVRIPWFPMLLAAAAGFLLAVLIFQPWTSPGPQTASGPTQTQRDSTSIASNGARQPDSTAHGAKDEAGSRRITGSQPDRIIETPQASKTQLVFAKGAIEMLAPADDTWRPLATGGSVDPQTRVRTGASGRCEFRTPDGSEVRLNGNTELVFHTNRKLELAQGQVWSNVAEDDEPYQIDVPQAQAKVTALGTQFDLACGVLATVLTVVQGTTRVEGSSSRVDVHFGEQAKIVAGAVAERRRVHDLVVATSWVHEILMLKGHDNAELAKRMDDMLAQIGNAKMSFMVEKEILQLGDHCVLPLTRFIQSAESKQDRQKRANAARILAKIARPWSVEDLIGLLDDHDREVRFHAAKALERLTDGQTHGLTPESWRDAAADNRAAAVQRWHAWWQENRERLPTAPFAMDSIAKDKPDEPNKRPTKL
jgi:ferric-dicitrate binding protein FerR (iron transport regulator)